MPEFGLISSGFFELACAAALAFAPLLVSAAVYTGVRVLVEVFK